MKSSFNTKRARGVIISALALAITLAIAGSASAAPSPPFTQCPPVGADTSCGTLIVVNSSGGLEAFNDPTQGPFDGVEDTLIGVENLSSSTVTSIALEGENIFGFDGDGICSGFYSPAPSCEWEHPTSYEGPNTSFEVTDAGHGKVIFPSGLVPKASTYFSLEGPVRFSCEGESCKGHSGEECKIAKGVGHFGAKGPEGMNEDNSLSTSGTPRQFELSLPSGEHIHTYKLEASKCENHEFSGSGKASVNGQKGYSISFAIRTEGKKVFLTVLVEKESKVVYSVTNQELNKASKETIS